MNTSNLNLKAFSLSIREKLCQPVDREFQYNKKIEEDIHGLFEQLFDNVETELCPNRISVKATLAGEVVFTEVLLNGGCKLGMTNFPSRKSLNVIGEKLEMVREVFANVYP